MRPNGNYWREHKPVILCILLLAVLVSLPLIVNRGSFSYPLDDTYIHMVIGDNLAHKGLWGVNGKDFASAASSILYPLILAAAFKLADNQLYIPLYLNIAAAFLCMLALNSAMRYFSFSPRKTTLALIVILLSTPLPAITIMGMEHTLHVLLTVMFVLLATRMLVSDKTGALEHTGLLVVTLLFMSVRYESLFFLPFFLMALLLQRKYLYFLTVLTVAILPTVVFGIYSIEHGGYFFPNTLIIKSFLHKSRLIGIYQAAMDNIKKAPPLISLLIGSTFLLLARDYPRIDFRSRRFMVCGLFVSASLIHLLLAAVGRFYRYEAYLVTTGLLAVFVCLPQEPWKEVRRLLSEQRFNRLTAAFAGLTILFIPVLNNLSVEVVSLQVGPYTVIIAVSAITLAIALKILIPHSGYRPVMLYSVLFCILIAPIISRGILPELRIPVAMTNIYEQQYQMGAFVNKYYKGRNIAVNDLGAVSYFGNAHVLDLWGLGDKEPLEAKRRHEFDTDFIQRIIDEKKIDLLIVYDKWFERYGGFPGTFTKVGEWTISNNVVCGHDTVSFYATDSVRARKLEANLLDYRKTLPPAVRFELFPVH